MTALLNYLASNPIFGIISAATSGAVSNAMKKDLIPDGVEEVTMYIATVLGLGIAGLTFIGMVRKEIKYHKNKPTK